MARVFRPSLTRRFRLVTLLSAGVLALAGLLLSARPAAAQDAPATPATPLGDSATAVAAYRTPPKVLVDLTDASRTPQVRLDPSRQWLLVLPFQGLPPIAELAQRELRLAGLRIDPRANGLSRRPYFTGMKLVHLADRAERAVTGLPEAPRIGGGTWSPDGAHVAFTLTRRTGIELWVLDVASGQTRRVSDVALSLILNPSPAWASDGQSLLCALVPAGRSAEPAAPEVPPGPVEQETAGHAAPARTYQDLLKNGYDEALFEHYATAQLARVGLDGKVTPLGSPGLRRLAPSPDGKYLLVETVHRPYSYLVPLERFPQRVEVWDASGTLVKEIADLPLREQVPISFDSVPAGPRRIHWRDDAPATLAWVEALDGGDAGRKADVRDRVAMLAAPFADPPRTLVTLGYRVEDLTWGRGDLALVSERWWKTRRTRTWIVKPDAPAAAPELLFDRSYEDRYSDPGDPQTKRNAYGRPVLLTANGGATLFFAGTGAAPEGERPFLDALDLIGKAPRQPKRLFRSAAPYFEEPVDLLDDAGKSLLVRRESPSEPPNYFVRDLAAGKLRPVTAFPNPVPQLAGVHKEVIHYRRADGVELSATLYLPSGYKAGDGPLPLLMWAYPQEFKSADAAAQVTPSPYRFEQVNWYSPMIWVTRGYAVLDNPTMPIVGAGEAEPNDTYVQQLVADAQAAVDEVVRRGVADRGRIAIAGHSYGAFMTANLLAHSRLFATGIAMSGAYNRTLTPFGFQSEERSLWQSPAVYAEMSPYQHADKVAAPVLLVHGQADNNAGTDPVQSERFYNAVKGLGGTARLVLLPYESHTYRGRES
ncbi:MAG TPA: prolyl oligopeptidase family serine peptidase, partial [Thermoanaerobaculia bacterium]|nr:prolyl oligopeptidase family serine peptidase [Thermoanaerobaculia bacterium]